MNLSAMENDQWKKGGGLVFVWLVLLALFAQYGCQKAPPTEEAKPIVLVSVPPQAYFVERLAEDLVQVEIMVPPGANPATFEPGLKQMQAASRARVYVTVGHPNFPFEKTWLEKLVENNKELTLVDCNPDNLKSDDPHIWVSPDIAVGMTRKIHQALVELLPEHKERLDENRDAFLAEIAILDLELSRLLEARESRKFLVFHPAWGHFAAHYGLEQIPIEQGMKEPSSAALSQLIEQARRERIKLVFVQPQFSKKHARLVAREIGGKVVEADPLNRDWAETLRHMAQQLREPTP